MAPILLKARAICRLYLFMLLPVPILVLSGPAEEDDAGSAFQQAKTIPPHTVHRMTDGALYSLWTFF